MKVIIMAGGSGSRLWPLSRTNYPKQFLKLKGMGSSIFQLTVDRSLCLCALNDIYFVTHKDYFHLISGQLEEMGLGVITQNILLEPEAKNTLPAIMYAIKTIKESKGDDDVAVFSSDHLINDVDKLVSAVKNGQGFTDRYLITFGVTPGMPETGYGYIKPGKALGNCFEVEEFKEKPDFDTAKSYVEEGYYWNSGIFLFGTKLFLEETHKCNPEVFEAFQHESIQECYSATPVISIDYGLMEKTKKAAVIPFNGAWNDLGSFATFYAEFNQSKDESGNVFFNDEIILDSENNMVYSESDKVVAMVGVSDLVVVDQKDALLICNKDDTQRVRDVVEILKNRNDSRADYHLTEYRPWGNLTVLENNMFYKVRKLLILPHKRLSYQMHYHRSEHWMIVNGTASVTIEGEEKLLFSGESIYISAGHKHRLHNVGKISLEVIEVQIGQYINEDDIVRFDDDFGR